jgi:hypothetical protein
MELLIQMKPSYTTVKHEKKLTDPWNPKQQSMFEEIDDSLFEGDYAGFKK